MRKSKATSHYHPVKKLINAPLFQHIEPLHIFSENSNLHRLSPPIPRII